MPTELTAAFETTSRPVPRRVAGEGPTLADALARGGIVGRVTDGERRAMFRGIGDALPACVDPDRVSLLRTLATWEDDGFEAVGLGIAIPRPERPVVLPSAAPAVRLMFLAEPLAAAGPDGLSIDTLFLVLAPSEGIHLDLLARLRFALGDIALQALLAERVPSDRLLAAVRRREGASRHMSN